MASELNKKSIHDAIGSFEEQMQQRLDTITTVFNELYPFAIYGRVISAHGTIIQAYVPQVKVGDLCSITDAKIGLHLKAEVVAIDSYGVKLLPYGNIENVSQDCLVSKLSASFTIKVGDFLLAKVIDGFGKIIGDIGDGDHTNYGGADNNITGDIPLGDDNYHMMPVFTSAPSPLQRPLINTVFVTGVKALDMFITCGIGQRLGIFAPPGVGKTTLMGMIIRNSAADVVVVALVGERGREVREFIDLEINEAMRKKCVIVVATSDRPPVEQVKCPFVAQTIAEYFRDQGKKVLLFVDSMTRFARAQREVGLSAGEPIARGGFPPSVFLALPRLMERAGTNQHGSITAFYTVLTEDDDVLDSLGEECKSILDGHIMLNRGLAEKSQYPAINVLNSLSRVSDRIISQKHLEKARYLRMLLAEYKRLEFVIRIGEYTPKQNELSDKAVNNNGAIMEFLRQTPKDTFNFATQVLELNKLG